MSGKSDKNTSQQWFSYTQEIFQQGEHKVLLTTSQEWDKDYTTKLRQSGDLAGLIPVLDSDTLGKTSYAVTPLPAAPTLETLLEQGSITWQEAASALEAATHILSETHARELFHGALSPASIHIQDGEVALSNVGLSWSGTPEEDLEQWTAPELQKGAYLSESSDVYSLGKTLEKITESTDEEIPRSLKRLIMWSASELPEARPPAEEFASHLADGLGDEKTTYGPAFIDARDLTEVTQQARDSLAAQNKNKVSLIDDAEETISDDTSELRIHRNDIDQKALDIKNLDPIVGTKPEIAARPASEELENLTDTDDNDSKSKATAPVITPLVPLDEESKSKSGVLIGTLLALLVVGAGFLYFGNRSNSSESAGESQDTAQVSSEDSEQEDSKNDAAISDEQDASAVTSSQESNDNTKDEASKQQEPSDKKDEDEKVSGPTTQKSDSTETTASKPAAVLEQKSSTRSAVKAQDLGVQILHAIPDTDVDVYLNGDLLLRGFSSGDLAGPADLDPGSYDLALLATQKNPASKLEQRKDTALVTDTVEITKESNFLVAHLDSTAAPSLSVKVDSLDKIKPGAAKLVVHHLANAPKVDVAVGNTKPVTGLAASKTEELTVDAGEQIVSITAEGKTLLEQKVTVTDGQLANIVVFGSAEDNTLSLAVQKISGLSSTPTGIPSGNSGLAAKTALANGLPLLAGLTALLLAGGFFATRRSFR